MTIAQIILTLFLSIALISMVILLGARLWWPFQYIYMNTYARWSNGHEYLWYHKAKKMLQSGKHVPVIYLGSYTKMQVYESDKWKQFLTDYPLFFIVFPDEDICLYSKDENVICSFWNILLRHLMKIAGSSDPKKAVQYIIQEGKKEDAEHEAACNARIAQLEKEIASVKENNVETYE